MGVRQKHYMILIFCRGRSEYDRVQVTPTEFNNDCVRQLERSNFTRRIAVIGCGPSSPIIAPLKSLMRDLESHCGVRRKSNEYFWNYCSRAFAANKRAYYKVIAESYGASPHWDSRAYGHLVEIPFPSYVTFNYDDQLPNAFKQKYPTNFTELFSVYPAGDGQMTAVAADLQGPKRRLVAVHGYCDPNNPKWHRQIILKTEDYDYHYTNRKTRHYLYNWWKNLLATQSCVFIGTSLREPGLSHVVDFLLEDQNQRFVDLDHIHLRDCRPVKQTQRYPPSSKTLGAFRQVLFDRLDDRFSGLLEVLSPFSGIDIRNPSPGMAEPSPITQTDKFDF